MQEIVNIISLIDTAISDDPNNSLFWWNIIKNWYSSDIDEARDIITHSKDWLANYQSDLAKKSWIGGIKIKYTNAAGYFIEMGKSYINEVPNDFIHKQTLVNAIRYSTQELDDFSKKMYQSESQLSQMEYDTFCSVRVQILASFDTMKKISEKITYIDYISSLWLCAYKNNYSKPKMSLSYELKINSGRHPIIETIEPDFISNSLRLDNSNFVHIITWPNMWWKSTFLRQNALIILLSHIWSFVPSSNSIIPLTDKLFSRVWATDNLYLGQSTFMVEMQEVAYILNNSTEKSFVIIDEVWRGTSTYDGISLAWAILLYNHNNIKAKTLFATHYHELVDESKILNNTKNFSVAVWENDENIVFLRKIIPGWIKKSYGHQVAQLAGIPKEVILCAQEMLKKLEVSSTSKNNQFQLQIWSMNSMNSEKILIKRNEREPVSETYKKIQALELDQLTAKEALDVLYEYQKLSN